MNELTLTPEEEQPQSLSITPESLVLPPDPEVAKKRARKISYSYNKNYDATLTALSAGGGEESMRQQTAASTDIEWQQHKNMIIRNIVEKSGNKISPEQYDVLRSMSKEDYRTDPDTVFEKKYAEKYIKDTVVDNATSSPEGLWSKAFRENPEATTQNMKIAADRFATAQYANKKVEDLHEEAKQNGVLSTIWNFVKSVTPGVSWYNQTRILGEAPWTYLALPGKTKREQIQYILSLPLPEAKRAIDTSIATLKGINFNDAKTFAENLKEYTSAEQLMDSSTGVLDIASMPYKTAIKIAGFAGRKVGSVFGGTSRAAELASADATKIPPIKEIQQEVFRGPPKTPEQLKEEALTHPPAVNYNTQLDLFRGDPRQGDLFPSSRAGEAATPPALTGLPPGKLRSTYKPIAQQEADANTRSMLPGRSLGTGRFEAGQGAYNQLPLDLRGGAGQRRFDFDVPPPRTPPSGGGTPAVVSATRATQAADQQIALNAITKAADEISPASATTVVPSTNFVSGAIYGAMERLQKAREGTIRLADGLPSYMDPGNYFGNGRALSNAFINAAIQRAEGRRNTFEKVLDNSQRITRIPAEVEKRAFDEASSKLLDRFTHRFNDAVLDVVHLPAQMFKSNVGQAVLRLGKTDKTLFTSRESAELYARDVYKLADDEYKIYLDNGSNYYVGIPTSIAENSDGTLNIFKQLKNVVETNMFTLLSKFRVADDYLTAAHSAQRKVAAHGQQNIRELVRTTAETFTALGRKASKEVETVINDFGNQRKWYDTSAEFENAFLKRHQKIATNEQIEAAFVYKQLQDYDFMIRNLGVYRDMARQGAEQFTIRTSRGVVEAFDGIQHAKLPWGRSEDFTIALVKPNEEPRIGWGHQADRAEGKLLKSELEDLMKEGYVVIQTFKPSEKPLSKLFPEVSTPINYIVTKTHEAKPLKWEQLKYEPGPHSIYPYEFYIKQPVMQVGHLGKTYYYGDNTLWNFSTEAEAKMWLGRLNEGRVLFNNKDPNFDAWLSKNLPMTKTEFQSLKNQFDFDVPFSYTRAGRSVFETQTDLAAQFPDAINFHKSSHNPQNFMDRSFIQERNDLLKNPNQVQGVMKMEEAKQLDAYHALQRGINQSIRGMWLNDYKVGSTLQWIENYADLMDVDLKNLRATPLFYLYNPKWKHVANTGDSYTKLVAAEAERQAIVNFIGQGSDFGNAVTTVQNKIMNTVYDRLGSNSANYFADFHLGFIKDPVPFFRGLAAHTKIGLFNPIAGFQQAMVMANVAAISGPAHAVPATAAAFLMNGLTHTASEAIINSAAKKLTRFGWTEADAKEMIQAYRSTGLNTVGAEAALKADNFDSKLFKGTIGTWMDKGFLFFNMGERLGRKGSFAAAYREWKIANPTSQLTEEALAGIGNRADTMTGNMTSASLANIQQGVASIPLQFTTYFKHMAELMLGGRITTAEKARLFAMNSMLFGIPVAAGVGGIPGAIAGAASGLYNDPPKSIKDIPGTVLSGAGRSLATAVGMWPFYDDIKEELRRKGWDTTVNSNMFLKGLAEGIPSMMIKLILDKDVEVGKTYGAGGSSIIRDVVRQDKGFMETLAGASGSVVKDIFDSVDPFLGKLLDTFGMQDKTSGVQTSDLMKALRNIGAVDIATRTYAAFVYGKNITKQGVEIGGLDTMDAALLALRLNPKKVQDVMYDRNILKDQKAAQEKFENLAIESLRRANQNANQGDWKKYDEYLKDAKAYMTLGEFSPSEHVRIFRRAVDESRGIEENTARQKLRRDPGHLQINQLNNQFFTKGTTPE